MEEVLSWARAHRVWLIKRYDLLAIGVLSVSQTQGEEKIDITKSEMADILTELSKLEGLIAKKEASNAQRP